MTAQLTSTAVEIITTHNRQADLMRTYKGLLDTEPMACISWFKALSPYDLDLLVTAVTARKGARP